MRVSSYQKLKQRIEKMREYQLRMLEDTGFYIHESLMHKVEKDVEKAVMYGDVNSKATGFTDLGKYI